MDTPLITLYHYGFSPYARRIQWYLTLRGLPYSECMQPPVLPRPDLARLGVRHRRIPVVAIGRDVYLDTRLILQKLEAIPGGGRVRPPLGVGAGSGDLAALERLLEVLTVDTNLFLDAGRLIPPTAAVVKDPAFARDRAEFLGKPVKKPASTAQPTQPTVRTDPALLRAESLAEIRHFAATLETTLLADGRDWLLRTTGPSLADVHAVWPLHWLTTMPGAFCYDARGQTTPALSPDQFPRVFAWIARFTAAVKAARAAADAKPARVDGAAAAAAIWASDAADGTPGIDATDPVAQAASLTVGQSVVVWPIDTGALHKDIGKLVRLAPSEVVIEVAAPPEHGGRTVLLHAPRHMFRVRPHSGADGAKL